MAGGQVCEGQVSQQDGQVVLWGKRLPEFISSGDLPLKTFDGSNIKLAFMYRRTERGQSGERRPVKWQLKHPDDR